MSDNTRLANQRFDASLPAPYKTNWREAYRADTGESPRQASYQPPGGEAIPFVQKSFRFSGGQSRDTAEYPFGGLWSTEYINEKPQRITVEGYLRGSAYIVRRNKLIEALRVPTDDDNPGFIDLPFWGRFPVVVDDTYEVSENTDEQGQCAVSISFTRAGVSVASRMDAESSSPGTRAGSPPPEVRMEKAKANLEIAAIDDFDSKLGDGRLDNAVFASGFGQVKNTLLGILGRIQGAQTFLNAMTNEALGIMGLINKGIRAPYDLAKTLFNAVTSIVGGFLEIKNSTALYGRTFYITTEDGSSSEGGSSGSGASRANGSAANKPSLPLPDNAKNILLQFLSSAAFSLPIEAATVREDATKTAIENLYRTAAFMATAQIIANTDSLTYQKAASYWSLIERLAESIDQENPAIYRGVQDMLGALALILAGRRLGAEMRREVSVHVPLLYLAYYLGCDENKIRELNSIADSFTVEGDVIYV